MRFNSTTWNRLRYTLYAPFYNITKGLFGQARKRSIELANLVSGEKVLLLGVGTGLDFEYLPQDVDITAIDLTPLMVSKAENFAKSRGYKAKFEVMDAEKLTFEEQQFDCVILHLILAVVPNAEACAKEISRVLKDNGRVVILDKFLSDNQKASVLRRIFNIFTSTLFSDINRQLGPILAEASLAIKIQETSILNGAFTITKAEKVS